MLNFRPIAYLNENLLLQRANQKQFQNKKERPFFFEIKKNTNFLVENN
jgi:hypothetical protein